MNKAKEKVIDQLKKDKDSIIDAKKTLQKVTYILETFKNHLQLNKTDNYKLEIGSEVTLK